MRTLALYRSQVYLLDDPLSACDAHVSAALMREVIGPKGLLRDKLRVLSASQLEHTTSADAVYVLQSGEVAEVGTHSQLAGSDGPFARLLRMIDDDAKGVESAGALAERGALAELAEGSEGGEMPPPGVGGGCCVVQ